MSTDAEASSVEFVREPNDIEAAVALLSELNEVPIADTLARLRLAQAEGLQLVGVFTVHTRKLWALATFRFCWRLYCGRTVYIDDFIVAAEARFKGYGSKLFRWLVEHAKTNDCVNITLDTGVRVFGAHKFYHRHGMRITSHHMTLDFNAPKHYVYPPGAAHRASDRTQPMPPDGTGGMNY
jgi:GNAT superfamily N-acetyltransferase